VSAARGQLGWASVTAHMRRDALANLRQMEARGFTPPSRYVSEPEVTGQAEQNRLSGRRYCRQQMRLTRGLGLLDL
jgi:hypothetical protein